MASILKKISTIGSFAVTGLVTSTILCTPTVVLAQGATLEEIIVTAQRREQSLQEVPISLEVINGATMQLQGYRNFEDLSKFSPSVTIRDGSSQQSTTIRGFGTEGNSLTLQAAAPIFLDGIHFGRPSMIKTAFMDTERVEILKGPQPLHFGMNATAGAFNIISRRPPSEWEGDVSTEIANDRKMELEAALGGPLTDTLGIRLAALVEQSDGPVKNRITEQRYLGYNNLAGRISLQWIPTDKFNLLGKFEISDQDNAGELFMGCLTEGDLVGFRRGGPLAGPAPTDTGNERAVYAPPPKGLEFQTGAVLPSLKDPDDCFKGEYGISRDGPFLEPPQNIFNERSSNGTPGYLDIREASEIFTSATESSSDFLHFNGVEMGGAAGKDETLAYNFLVDWTYVFDNGVTVNSQTGAAFFDRVNIRENCDCFFFSNHFGRKEDYEQWSQQVRVETPAEGFDFGNPGGVTVNAMIGAFVQESDLGAYTNSLRADVRNGQRLNNVTEESKWFAAFWNLDLNFFDKQLTLSLGGRFTDIEKDTGVAGYTAQWIFDVRPCDSSGTDADPTTCTLDPDFKQVDPSLTSYTTFDAINGIDSSSGRAVRVDSPRILVDPATVDMSNLWTARNWSSTREVPLSWRRPDVNAVGLTAPERTTQNGPYGRCALCAIEAGGGGPIYQTADNYDSQFVLSFTPNALNGNHTFYGKYASAFKGPVTDTGLATIASDLNDITFLPEFSTAYEIGAKGLLFDGRFRYEVTAFQNKFTDLQTEGAAAFFNPTDPDQVRVSLNAGEQRVDGIEFAGQFAATENLTLNFAGAIMDGEMRDFDGAGCTPHEFIAAAANAVNNPGSRSAEELAFANDILDDIGTARAQHALTANIPAILLLNGGCRLEDEVLPNGEIAPVETFNRSGDVAPRTPDYKFVFGLDYERPVMNDRFVAFFNAQGFISDSWLTGEGSSLFERRQLYDKHGDINLSAGLADRDGKWRIIGFARNILEATPVYQPEYDFEQEGFISAEIQDSSFLSYGVRIEYQFR